MGEFLSVFIGVHRWPLDFAFWRSSQVPFMATDGHRSTTQQTAPSNNSIGEKFQVTHPFHPLRGEEVEAEGRTGRWGEERVWFRTAGGDLRTIPLRFTSWAGMEPYVEVGGGRSWYRANDLMELVRLIAGLRQEAGADV
jgi:hypothetical protein